MDANSVAELRASLAKVPYQARWVLLKPTIKRLYIDEGRHVTDVAEIIKRDYGFGALYVPKTPKLLLSVMS
jgi:Clr5 domain